MEAACGLAVLFPWSIGREKTRKKWNSFSRFGSEQLINVEDIQWRNIQLTRRKLLDFPISRCCRSYPAHALESGNCCASFDEKWLLKRKGEKAASLLNGRCVFLVGMMGSGKTTVGKVLAEALEYSFVDSDKFVEEALGASSVSQIFQQCGEGFFRDYESDALKKLSSSPQQVVATGGGAVIRPINWTYMKQGVSVFIDVPLDALARRIAAVGTDSRPLLHFEAGDPYTKAFMGLFTLSKKRAEEYGNADATVSLQDIAAEAGIEDVTDLTPNAIAIEVLGQLENFLKGQ